MQKRIENTASSGITRGIYFTRLPLTRFTDPVRVVYLHYTNNKYRFQIAINYKVIKRDLIEFSNLLTLKHEIKSQDNTRLNKLIKSNALMKRIYNTVLNIFIFQTFSYKLFLFFFFFLNFFFVQLIQKQSSADVLQNKSS